jgi:hypothetical protein
VRRFGWGYDDDRPSPVRHLAECGDTGCGTHRLHQPEVRPKFHTFCLRRLAVAIDEENAFPGASQPSPPRERHRERGWAHTGGGKKLETPLPSNSP